MTLNCLKYAVSVVWEHYYYYLPMATGSASQSCKDGY